MKTEDFFIKSRSKCHTDEELERTKESNKLFKNDNGEQSTKLYCESDVLLADIFEKLIIVSFEGFYFNPLYCVSLPSYTWQYGLKYTDIKLQTLQDKDLILLLKKSTRGGIGSVMGDRCVKLDDNKKILYIDANKLYSWTRCQT